MIPTSTPPTIDKKGKIIYINYKVRVTVNLNSKHSTKRKNIIAVELPIVVGTWPRAAVPIDEDDEWIDGMDDLMLSDEEMAADNDSLYDYSVSEQNFVPDIQPGGVIPSAGPALHNQSSFRTGSDWRLSTSSTSSSASSATVAAAAAAAARNSLASNTIDIGVIRSDSNASRASVRSAASISSQKSSHSFESSQERLTRNTSVSTTASAPEFPTASVRYVRTTPVPPPPPPPPPPPFSQPSTIMKTQSSYIPRSSSTTDLNRPPNVPSQYMQQQQPPYDDAAGLYWQRGPPTMDDPRFRGVRPLHDPSYSGINGNGHIGYPPAPMHNNSTTMYDQAQKSYSTNTNYGRGRHIRTPSESSHLYHMQQLNYPAKFSPMPAVPDTQRNMQTFAQDDLGRTNYAFSNLPQFTPPRNHEASYAAVHHRHSDPQTVPSPIIHPPVLRSDSDPAAYSTVNKKAEQETSSSTAQEHEVVECQQTYGYYDSSDSSSEFGGGNGDAAGSASDDSDDSADEGDLLRIVEKKRRQEQKEMKRRQRRVFTIAE